MATEGRPTLDELKKLKVVELKARLSSFGLQTSGLKADLIARLDSYFESIATVQPAHSQETGHTVHTEEYATDQGCDNKTENDSDTVETEVYGLEYHMDHRSDSETVTIEGNVMEVSVPECEIDNRSDSDVDDENELQIVEEDSECENDNELENTQEENEGDTCEVHVENQKNNGAESGVASADSNITEVSVDPSILESVTKAVEQNKVLQSVGTTKKKRRRRAGETSGRQKGLKRLRKEQQAGVEEECDVIFAKKNWPPPFEESVIAMRSSLMQFSKKTEGWTKDDMAELRAYYKCKWKVEKGYESALNHYFKVAALSSRCFVAARQMMDNHKKKYANGKSLWRRVVRPGLFDCLRKLCPIENEEQIYEVLKSYAEGKIEQGIRTAPTYEYPPTRNYKRKGPKVPVRLPPAEEKFKDMYDQLKLDYDKLKKDKDKLARINAQLVKTISSLTELLQDRSLVQVSETMSSEEPQNEGVPMSDPPS